VLGPQRGGVDDLGDHPLVSGLPRHLVRRGLPRRLHLRVRRTSVRQIPNRLYIDPEECIDCQACEPVCPWEAPLSDTEVPATLEDDIALNASIVECKDKFRVPRHTDKPQPAGRRRRQQGQVGMARLTVRWAAGCRVHAVSC
jgi:NAD-dependent dihydropyrimidine dehydrogenase PreA subunit